jgi:hypothetical protein
MHGSEFDGKHSASGPIAHSECVGALLALRTGLEFAQGADPGNSNEQIVIDALQHIQPGDVVVVGWTYTNRFNHRIRYNDDELHSSVVTAWEMTAHLSDNNLWDAAVRMRNKLGFGQDADTIKTEISNEAFGCRTNNRLMRSEHSEIRAALADWYTHVYAELSNRLYVFLTQYNSVQAIAHSRGAKIMNVHYDMESDITAELENLDTKGDLFLFTGGKSKAAELDYGPNYLSYPAELTHTELYNSWKRDAYRLEYNLNRTRVNYKDWAMTHIYNSDQPWPESTAGHLTPTAHVKLAADFYTLGVELGVWAA